MSIEWVLREVSSERLAQEIKFGPVIDDAHSVNDWVAIVTRHAGLCAVDGNVEEDLARFRRQMIRVAAVAVAAVQTLDRKSGNDERSLVLPTGSGW